MQKLLSSRESIQALLELEWKKYKQAINDDRTFEEIKNIYLRIKELQSQITDVTNEIHSRLNMGD